MQSVQAQAVEGIEHIVIRDDIGIGIGGVFLDVRNHLDLITGDYVYFLQDDDALADDEVVTDFYGTVGQVGRHPVFMVKNVKGDRLLPDYWGERPKLGHVDLGGYIVRADIFKMHAADFGARYEGDFDFIDALWRGGYPFYWWDRIFARSQQIGKGRPELSQEKE